jgi:O-methyltransferase
LIWELSQPGFINVNITDTVFLKKALKALGWLFFGSPSHRRRARQEGARIAAGLFGDYPISEDYKLWRTDTEFLSEYKRLSPYNSYSQDRKFLLRELARFTKNVPGAMAECGCFQGASAYFLAKERPETPLYLFDSFEGLSAVTDLDKPGKSDHFEWQSGDFRAAEKIVRNTLRGYGNVFVHKGWIPEKFHEVDVERFSLVHIDVDLYQPTLDSMKFFYPRMQRRGVIVLDDYGFTTCPGACKAVQEFMADKPEYVLHLPTGQGLIIM